MPTKAQWKVIGYSVLSVLVIRKVYNAFAPSSLKQYTGEL